jgi:hypothetical protein
VQLPAVLCRIGEERFTRGFELGEGFKVTVVERLLFEEFP